MKCWTALVLLSRVYLFCAGSWDWEHCLHFSDLFCENTRRDKKIKDAEKAIQASKLYWLTPLIPFSRFYARLFVLLLQFLCAVKALNRDFVAIPMSRCLILKNSKKFRHFKDRRQNWNLLLQNILYSFCKVSVLFAEETRDRRKLNVAQNIFTSTRDCDPIQRTFQSNWHSRNWVNLD